MEKVKHTTNGYGCFEHCTPLETSSSSTSAPLSRLLRCGAVVLVVGVALVLCASAAALHLWKVRDENVYNVRYSMNINGAVREGSVEIDSDSNLERFKTGSGAEEAVEIHDFQIGITGIRFYGGDKCYVKSQIKANLPHRGAHDKESLMLGQTDELMPVRFDDGLLVWVAGEQPLKDTSFLSPKILGLCGELPIHWLQPTFPKDGERSRRDTRRAKRQFSMEEFEAAAEQRDPVSQAEDDTSRAVGGEEGEEEEKEGAQSAAGSAFNPENPYHRGGAAGGGEGAAAGGAVTFDTMLDQRGICCSECQRSYTHCQRICEPLRGYWPWPYDHRGCQVACRVIMPCRWWVARILGVV